MVLRTSSGQQHTTRNSKRPHRHHDTNDETAHTTTSSNSNIRNKRSRLDNLQRHNMKCNNTNNTNNTTTKRHVNSLLDISAKCVARTFPYQELEERLGCIPAPVQSRITYFSFPENEASIELYSSNNLHVTPATSTSQSKQPFDVGKKLYEAGAVDDVLQIGKWFSLIRFFRVHVHRVGYRGRLVRLKPNSNFVVKCNFHPVASTKVLGLP